MTQSNLRRRRNRPRSTTPSKKSVRKARFHFMLWGIILLVSMIGILWILQVGHRDSEAPTFPLSADSGTIPPLVPLELNGLSVKEQVAVLRAAAIELGQRIVTEFPRQAESHVLLGNTYRQLGQSTQAVDSWHKALTLDAQRADVYTYLAVLEEEKGNAEQALGHWQKVLLLKPTLPGLRDSLANTLMTLNQWDNAIEVLHEEMQLVGIEIRRAQP